MHKINYSLFVGNIPLEITQERLTLLFNQTGNVKYCSMFNRKCFIDYQTVLECENAIKKFNGHEVVPTKKLLVKFSDNTKKRLLQEKYPGMLETAENSSSKAAITKTNAVPPKVNGPEKALQNKTTLPPKKNDQIEMGNNKNDSEVVIGIDDASSAPKPCFSSLNFYDKKPKEALPLAVNANKVNPLAPKNGVSDIKGVTKNNLNGTVRVTLIPNSDTNKIPPSLNTKNVYKVTNNGIVKVMVDDNLVSDEDAASNIFPKYVKVDKPPNAVEHAKASNETKNSDVSYWPYIKSDDVGINKELQVLKTNINDELLTDIENKRISDDNISSPIDKVSKNDERPINIEKSKKNGFKNEADDFVPNVTGDSFNNMKNFLKKNSPGIEHSDSRMSENPKFPNLSLNLCYDCKKPAIYKSDCCDKAYFCNHLCLHNGFLDHSKHCSITPIPSQEVSKTMETKIPEKKNYIILTDSSLKENANLLRSLKGCPVTVVLNKQNSQEKGVEGIKKEPQNLHLNGDFLSPKSGQEGNVIKKLITPYKLVNTYPSPSTNGHDTTSSPSSPLLLNVGGDAKIGGRPTTTNHIIKSIGSCLDKTVLNDLLWSNKKEENVKKPQNYDLGVNSQVYEDFFDEYEKWTKPSDIGNNGSED